MIISGEEGKDYTSEPIIIYHIILPSSVCTWVDITGEEHKASYSTRAYTGYLTGDDNYRGGRQGYIATQQGTRAYTGYSTGVDNFRGRRQGLYK